MNNSLAQIIELLTTIYYVTVTLKKEKIHCKSNIFTNKTIYLAYELDTILLQYICILSFNDQLLHPLMPPS